jgi:hypothetical protein
MEYNQISTHIYNKGEQAITQFIVSPTKPPSPKDWQEAVKSRYKKHFIAAAFAQYTKNRKIGTNSLPIKRSELSHDVQVLRCLLVPEIKSTDVWNIFECRAREFIVGTPQVQGIHDDQLYCPSVEPTTLHVNLALAAMLRAYIGMIDIKNVFQTTQAFLTSKASYSSMPPFYSMQWLIQQDGFDYKKENGPYVRQLFAYLQGKKEASHKFYVFLASVFASFGLLPVTVDQGFFIKIFDNKDFLYVLVKTDDLLIIMTTESRFDEFAQFLATCFEFEYPKR